MSAGLATQRIWKSSTPRNGYGNAEFGSVVIEIFGTFVGQNLSQRLVKSRSNRLFLVTWLMFAFILGTVYRGNLTAALTLPRSPPRPESIQELVDSVDR